jgi:hypothetical protein
VNGLARQEPSEPQARAAWQVERKIAGHVQTLRVTWIRLAEDLFRFHKMQMWRDLGYQSFEQWLAEPYIELGRRQIFLLLDFWRQIVEVRGVDPRKLEGLNVSKVQTVLPAIRRGQVDVDKAISDAQTLTRDDLRKEYTGTDPMTGPQPGGFDATREDEWYICQSCGSRVKTAARDAA